VAGSASGRRMSITPTGEFSNPSEVRLAEHFVLGAGVPFMMSSKGKPLTTVRITYGTPR
jgi:hypothetical protein